MNKTNTQSEIATPDRVSWYYVNPRDGTEMVLGPGGWFQMGSADGDIDADNDVKPCHLNYVAPSAATASRTTLAAKGFVPPGPLSFDF